MIRQTPDTWVIRVVRCWLGIALLGLASPCALLGQCPWTMGPTCAPGGGGPYSVCSRIVYPSDACFLDMNNSMGTICAETTLSTSAPVVVRLMAVQTMTSLQASAYCEWGCGVATCRIEMSDGLPVELMEFSVNDAESESD